MLVKSSLLMTLTTEPTDRSVAVSHSGGWSETQWANYNQLADVRRDMLILAPERARCLPKNASVVGYRAQVFTISGNKVLPGGTSSGAFQYPGNTDNDGDIPQLALMCKGPSRTTTNISRFAMRAIPDAMVKNGEYAPTAIFKRYVESYLVSLKSMNFGFVGRDLSQLARRVVGITAGVVTVDDAAGLAEGQYVILRRVVDDSGNPVSGSFRILSVVGNALTLAGMGNGVFAGNSGTLRKDGLAYFNFDFPTVARVVVRKIGRPFEQYRGRASKKR